MIKKLKYIKEDFDFNKVKKQHIEDDYSMRHTICIANKLYPETIILNKVFNNTAMLPDLYVNSIKNILHIKDQNYGKLLIIGDIYTHLLRLNSIQQLRITIKDDFIGLGFKSYDIVFDNPNNNPFNKTSEYQYINYIIEFLQYYFKDIDFSLYNRGTLLILVSPDNGIIYMYKCIFENTVYDYLIMPNIILYTGEVLYNKEELSINEDFDFNKVKKHRIEDEYTIDLPTIVRRNLTNTVNIRDIVDPEILKLFEKYGKKKRTSYPNIGLCLGSIRFNGGHSVCIDDDLAQKLEDFGFDYHEEMGYEFNFSDDDYRLKLFDAVITVLTDGRITTCKDDDIMIEYYVSPDKGYIIINPTYFPDNEKIINPKYMKQPIICFTGLVDYNKY